MTTYTPRAIIFDSKFSLRALPVHGRLYDTPEEVAPDIPHKVEVRKEDSWTLNAFQRAREEYFTKGTPIPPDAADEGMFEHWTDIASPYIHPRTVHVCDLWEESATMKFQRGYDILKDVHFTESLVSDSHFFLEECDRPQGIQVSTPCACHI